MTYDYRPEATWMPADARQAFSAADEQLMRQLAQVFNELGATLPRMASLLALMRDAQGGHPRAATTTRDGVTRRWCWDHERTTDECDREGLGCAGELVVGPSDPTGNAAVISDRARRDHADLMKRVRLLGRVADEVAMIAARYPTEAVAVEPADGPGDEWCQVCWKDGQYHQPIDTKKNGTPYYAGKCKRCGEFFTAMREATGVGFDRPTWMLERVHRGERQTTGMVDRAIREHQQLMAEAASTKRKGKGKAKGSARRRPAPSDTAVTTTIDRVLDRRDRLSR